MKKIILMLCASLLLLSACGDDTGKRLAQAEPGQTITFGTFEQDNNAENGAEPIEWIVLDKNETTALLLSKYALDCVPYSETEEDVSWENSFVRNWLANDFLSVAFSEKEAARIIERQNDNKGNNDYGVPDRPQTSDRVFILSKEEIEAFFNYDDVTSTESVALPTEYAKEKGAELRGEGAVMWWVRSSAVSPNPDRWFASCVDDLGKIFARAREVNRTDITVRPAIEINIE